MISELEQLFTDGSVTDLHVTVQDSSGSVWVRRAGQLYPSGAEVTLDTLRELFPDAVTMVSNGVTEVDMAVELNGFRLRINAFRSLSGIEVAIRKIPSGVPELSELGLPPVVEKFAELKKGLVLVTGPTGSGKSTTLAAMVNRINETRACRIITIEDPIEYRHVSKKALISQREVGTHTTSFAAALRAALRQDPDVILVGEMRDRETMELVVNAALTGHLVLSTLHTLSAAKTVDRVIQTFPPEAQARIRADLADVIEGVICQQLLPKADGSGMVLACEVMVATTSIRNLIREGKTHQIPNAIATGKSYGMVTMEESLENLKRRGLVREPVPTFSEEGDGNARGKGSKKFSLLRHE